LLYEEKRPGEHLLLWDGMDKNGKEVGSGIYFYQLVAGERKITRKMVLLK
jgi:flagellar hook assembly protein FlgD